MWALWDAGFKLDFSFFLAMGFHILHIYGDQTKTKKQQQ